MNQDHPFHDGTPRPTGLSRRRFLRGLGACVALPALECLLPAGLRAANQAASPTGTPLRMAFVYFPNGAIQDAWRPAGEGKTFEFGPTMRPLEPFKQQVQVISGLG